MADDSAGLIADINKTADTPPPAPPAGADAEKGSIGGWLGGVVGGATAIANSAQGMLASAQSGQLKFDPATAQSLIKTLQNHIDDLLDVDLELGRVTRTGFKLGMTPGGQAVAPFSEQVVNTGDQAFAKAHIQFKQSLQTCVQAIQIAMDNYTKTEGDNAQRFKAKG